MSGSEALFANLGHFSVRSIQISSCTIVFPSIVLAYFGQVSYLRKHNQDDSNAFYSSVPSTFTVHCTFTVPYNMVFFFPLAIILRWYLYFHMTLSYAETLYWPMFIVVVMAAIIAS